MDYCLRAAAIFTAMRIKSLIISLISGLIPVKRLACIFNVSALCQPARYVHSADTSVDGLEEAEAEAKRQGIRFVRGIELSSFLDCEIHVLGYNMQTENPCFIRIVYLYSFKPARHKLVKQLFKSSVRKVFFRMRQACKVVIEVVFYILLQKSFGFFAFRIR